MTRSRAPATRSRRRSAIAAAPTACSNAEYRSEEFSMKGKTAIVTGSTSGIGHGIATALAASGCNVLLNGFGDAAEIEKIRADLASTHGIKVGYSPADMSKPADIRAKVALAASQLR